MSEVKAWSPWGWIAFGALGLLVLSLELRDGFLRDLAPVELEPVAILLGVAPNLFAVGLSVFAALTFFFPRRVSIDDRRRMRLRNAAFAALAILGMGGLVGWEFVQESSTLFVFDPSDLFATAAGGALSWAAYAFGAAWERARQAPESAASDSLESVESP